MLLILKFSLNWLVAAFTVLGLAATALSIHLERKFEKEISRISKILIFWKWVTQFTKWTFAYFRTFPTVQTRSYSLQTDKLDLTQQNYNCIIPIFCCLVMKTNLVLQKDPLLAQDWDRPQLGFGESGWGRPGQKFCWHDQAWAFHQCQLQQQILQTPKYILDSLDPKTTGGLTNSKILHNMENLRS